MELSSSDAALNEKLRSKVRYRRNWWKEIGQSHVDTVPKRVESDGRIS